MIHQKRKDILFFLIRKITVINHLFRRYVCPWKDRGRGIHLNLGCGNQYNEYFVNVDANPQKRLDLWLDVRNGLPFADKSVDSIYTAQMLEHLFPDELVRLLSDCRRALRDGGGMRIVVPNLKSAIIAYGQRRSEWFSNWPRSYKSVGGRFSNFIFCDGQHRNAFDFDYMCEVLRDVGFSHIQECQPVQSRMYDSEVIRTYEQDEKQPMQLLYVEAFR